LEEHVASIFRVEEYAKEETSMKELENRGIPRKMERLTTIDMRTSNPT
jgi:hypothetical protein